METRALATCAAVLCGLGLPGNAGAQSLPDIARTARAASARFDSPPAASTIVVPRPLALRSADAAYFAQETVADDEKVKLRWRYQPDDTGPRFEIGTYGSRNGKMKSKLLHVAVDWTF